MSLAQRLLLGAVVVVSVLVLAIVAIAGGRLRDRVSEQQQDALTRAARLAGAAWTPAADADSLADVAGDALGFRVTLVDAAGRVVGDSEFDGAGLAALENHAARPEIADARRTGTGTATRRSPSAGDEEMYAAVRHPQGVVRVSIGTTRVARIVAGAERDVLVAGLLAFLGAVLLAWVFARSISRPIVELRDVSRRMAGGDLDARAEIAAPGEVGDLASALHEMSEQLARRLQALRDDDALMSALVESLNEGVLALDARRRVVRANDRARDFLQLRGTLPVPADDLPRNPTLRASIDGALAGEATDPAELQLFGRTLAVTGRPLPMGGAVIALFDLTPVRRLELVRRDFVANVSHELKTPLTVVRGFAETLADPSVAAADRERFVATIVANAERMQHIVDDLLDLSRIESGGWVPAPGWVDIAGAVADTFTAALPAARLRGVALASESSVARVYTDPTALRQALGNLVENAVRYTQDGTVRVTAAAVDDGVEIVVADTGIGIAPEHLPRIFERFYRVDPARARAEGGTGLGLAIVKHLVEAHGGRVRATSVPGRGTAITLRFPGPPSAAATG